MSRPPQVDRELGCRVVKAIRVKVLPAGPKDVWREMRMLDNDQTRGCFAGTKRLAFALGMEEDTIRKCRQHLQRLGMLESENRREGRRFVWQWYPTLPVGCVPTGPSDDEIERSRDRLEAHIAAVLRGGHRTSPKRKQKDRGGTAVPAGEVAKDVLKGYPGTPPKRIKDDLRRYPSRV
ncbi:hypothetical protein LCGC14_3085710 [marine sediment metagenome]|uniref:Helix-turn-helix domain-containing protein n=1 Tax=marine sediment metagenome TaxID=412755 RepID=A0A0F8Z2J7_9ZZZZ